MGRGEKSKYLYLLDFGLAKKYRSSTTLKHYPMIKKKNLTGTARYASINALNGLTQSRRDDLEAVGYVLLYFLRGKLPWQGLHVKNKEDRYHKIMEIKRDTTPFQLCKGFPKEFETYVEYTRNLEYEQDPDYKFLKNLFNNVLKEDKNSDNVYDWDIGNKTMNTITTSNTSQKAFFLKDRERDNYNKDKYKKEINIFDNNNDFIDMQNILDNEINEFEENKNLKKIDFEINKFSIKPINSYEVYNSHDIKKLVFKSEENNNYFKKIKEKENNKDDERNILDSDYKDIMEMTEEGEEKDHNKCPNTSGIIHNKLQLEKKSNYKKKEEENKCIII
jgi:hypothetical protein